MYVCIYVCMSANTYGNPLEIQLKFQWNTSGNHWKSTSLTWLHVDFFTQNFTNTHLSSKCISHLWMGNGTRMEPYSTWVGEQVLVKVCRAAPGQITWSYTTLAVHSVLTRGALGEVVNLTKPMIESGLGGLDRPCASLITHCSSHLGHFYGQKLPKIGHIWVHRP